MYQFKTSLQQTQAQTVTRNTVSISSENTDRMKRLNKILANKSLIP